MKLTLLAELLRSTDAPYLIHLLREEDQLLQQLEESGMSVVQFDAVDLRTHSSVFASFGAAFHFPSPVVNYAGFEDWMRDLTWLNDIGAGWVVVIGCARGLLTSERSGKDTLLSSLASIGACWAAPVSQGEWWDRPAMPFHTLLID